MYQMIVLDEITWAFEAVMEDGDVCRFFVLDGEDRCLVIDSGVFPVDVKHMTQEHLKLLGRDKTPQGEEKPLILANTHGDMDHTGGNGSFDAFYLTQTDYERCHVNERFPDAELIPVVEGTEIELGGRTLRYTLTPGHTYGNTAILDVTNRTLFPGDIVQTGNIFMFGEHRCPEMLKESLIKVKNMKGEFDRIYASHGQIILPPDAVDQVIAAWDKVLNRE